MFHSSSRQSPVERNICYLSLTALLYKCKTRHCTNAKHSLFVDSTCNIQVAFFNRVEVKNDYQGSNLGETKIKGLEAGPEVF